MGQKRSRYVDVFVWGAAALLLVAVLAGCLDLSARTGAPFQSPDSAPVVTVVVTPTPDSEAPSALVPSEAFIEITPVPAMTYVAYAHPDDLNPVITYTLPEVGAIPARLYIPDIDLEAPVISIGWKTIEVGGATRPIWDVPTWRAAGWHETSAKVGAPGNTVLNGHNTSNGEVFRYLYKLDVGATILLEDEDGATYTYSVTERLILPEAGQSIEVRMENAQYAQPTTDERLTLVTCHPYGSLANRLLIIAHPVAPATTPSTFTEGD